MKKGSHHSKAARKKIAEHVHERHAVEKFGWPEVPVDLAEVTKLQQKGLGLRAIAKKLGVSVFKLQCARGVIDLQTIYKKRKRT